MIILKKTNSKSIPKANKNVSFGSAFRFIDLFVQKSRLWINPCKNINQLQSHCKISSVPASIDITNRYVSIITFAFRFSDVWCYHAASWLFLSQWGFEKKIFSPPWKVKDASNQHCMQSPNDFRKSQITNHMCLLWCTSMVCVGRRRSKFTAMIFTEGQAISIDITSRNIHRSPVQAFLLTLMRAILVSVGRVVVGRRSLSLIRASQLILLRGEPAHLRRAGSAHPGPVSPQVGGPVITTFPYFYDICFIFEPQHRAEELIRPCITSVPNIRLIFVRWSDLCGTGGWTDTHRAGSTRLATAAAAELCQ